jgi:hypothetical protein
MNARHMLALFATVVAATSFGIGARADDEAQTRAEAERYFQVGLRQLQSGEFEKARLSFLESMAKWRNAAALADLAIVESRTGHCVDALNHVRSYRTKVPTQDPAFLNEQVPQIGAACNGRVGLLRIAVAGPSTVAIDGRRERNLEGEIAVEPGAHTIVAAVAGREESRTVTVSLKQTVDVRFDSVVPSDAPPVGSAATMPPSAFETSGGLSSAPAPEGGVGPTAYWDTRRRIGAAVAGAGLLSAGAGVVFAVLAHQSKVEGNALAAQIPAHACSGAALDSRCGQLHSDYSRVDSQGDASRWLLGAGIVSAAAGAALMLWPPIASNSARAGSTTLTPIVAPTAVGIQLHGEL